VFLVRRPSNAEIERFLDRSHNLPLSYGPTGIVRHGSVADRLALVAHADPCAPRAVGS